MLNLVDCPFVAALGLVGGGPSTARRRDGRAIWRLSGEHEEFSSYQPDECPIDLCAAYHRGSSGFQKAVTQRLVWAQ